MSDANLPIPGLVGEVAKFIYASAPRPVAEIAFVGAIGLVAGISGRAYNVSGRGLYQYALLLANTGTGKEAMNREFRASAARWLTRRAELPTCQIVGVSDHWP